MIVCSAAVVHHDLIIVSAWLLFSRENSFCFVEVWSVFLTGYFRGFVRLQQGVMRRLGKRPRRAQAPELSTAVSAEIADMFKGIDVEGKGAVSRVDVARHLHADIPLASAGYGTISVIAVG